MHKFPSKLNLVVMIKFPADSAIQAFPRNNI